ncbi:MAG: rhodanese-like domain-containing protein [Armatimonadota bacterium]
MSYRELSPEEGHARVASGEVVVLDVRTLPEWRGGHIPGAVHIPLDELTGRYQELDPEAETLVVCAHGIRSAAAGQWLVQAGFDRIANLRYGMSAWPGPVERG